MHRRPLAGIIETYALCHPDEAVVLRFQRFVEGEPTCLERTCVPGHITASSWILSADGGSALLTHHAKLGRWLQLGGHVDGEPEVLQSAIREAEEESGTRGFTVLGDVLDLDVHSIPAWGQEPEHLHYDVRFLLRAAPDQALVPSDESLDLKWWPRAELRQATKEESVLRLDRKAAARGF